MRLLKYNGNGEPSLTEHSDNDIPQYAILSHRWGASHEEVTFKELIDGTGMSKVGYQKIRMCGEQARNDHIQYFWVDTCCINKESSAELSEAINSMWRWYQNATLCYVYLDDVQKPSGTRQWQSLPSFKTQFQKSKWFTRGWTLQELLASKRVEFLSETWTTLGNKVELCDDISTATGIQPKVILGDQSDMIEDYSAAEKLSWAARRQTSRIEDRAYCLLGLLNINMPLLYGEGAKAFLRLQEELVRSSNDESIFTWSPLTTPRMESDLVLFRGLACSIRGMWESQQFLLSTAGNRSR